MLIRASEKVIPELSAIVCRKYKATQCATASTPVAPITPVTKHIRWKDNFPFSFQFLYNPTILLYLCLINVKIYHIWLLDQDQNTKYLILRKNKMFMIYPSWILNEQNKMFIYIYNVFYNLFLNLFRVCVFVCVCFTCIYVWHTCIPGAQRNEEVKEVVSSPESVVNNDMNDRTKPGSSARPKSTPSYWSISPAVFLLYFISTY